MLEGERFALIQRAEGLASFTNYELRWFSRESGEMLRELPVALTDEQYEYLVRYVPTSEGEPSYEEPSLHFAGLTCNPWPEWRQLELG